MRHILSIEAEYVRMYINSLALQAVVERLSNNANNENINSTLSTASMSPTSRSMTSNIHPSTLMSLYGGDQEFVKEVVEASRSLLSTVVEGLLPNEYLKHCPIRTYFRIISGAMFLLKVSYAPLLEPTASANSSSRHLHSEPMKTKWPYLSVSWTAQSMPFEAVS
jgi:hypothetical protein